MNWQNICNLQSNDPNLSCNHYINSITYLLDEFACYLTLHPINVKALDFKRNFMKM